MTVLARLERWRTSGAITPTEHDAISSIEGKDRFSLFVELNVLLYLGVLSVIAGVGWTIDTYFESLGDAAIIVSLTMLCGGALYYCFARALPYEPGRVESPGLGFDYVLYLGALVFGVELAYIESRFQLLGESWDYYLLISAAVFFVLAYRFDNRLVLSLALSSLAGWFGLSLTRYGIVSSDALRVSAIAYGVLAAGAGTWLSWRVRIKPHFLRTYLHIGANAIFLALVSGVIGSSSYPRLYLLMLLVASGLAIYGGFQLREFAFAAYGTIYGYIGLSVELLRQVRGLSPVLAYVAVSGAMVVVFIGWLAAKIRRKQ